MENPEAEPPEQPTPASDPEPEEPPVPSEDPEPEPSAEPEPEPEPTPTPSADPEPTPSADPEPAKPVMELGALRALAIRQKGGGSNGQSARRDFTRPPSDDETPSAGASASFDHTDFLDDTSDGKVRHFDDLFSRYPIGDGEFQIYVERKNPKLFRGHHIGGMQKPIESVIDHATFAARYGSGTYSLTVYGPLPRKGKGDDGQLKRKAYTRPIKVEVPDPFEENPPNPEMAAVAAAEEVEMAGVYGMRRGGATDADAEIERAKLEHEQVQDERQWTRQERLRAMEEKKQREREEAERAKELSQLSLMERMLRSRDEEIRQLREAPSKDVAALPFMPDLINAMKPQGPDKDALESERRHHAEELSRLRDGHNSEVHRIRDEHSKELERLRSDFNKNIQDERERNERLMREKEESARKQIEDARNEATRRVTELRESYEARLSDERRQHDRDLATAQAMNNNSSSTISSSFEMRLEVKQQEINRLSQELAHVRSELDEEKSKTLADRVGEFAGAAEALGYSKEEGEKGWKEMLGEAAVGLVQNVPALASNITASLRGQPQVPMLPQQSGAGMVPQQHQNYGPVFATDGVDLDLEYPNAAAPIQPGQDPYEAYEEEESQQPQPQPQYQPQAAQTPPQQPQQSAQAPHPPQAPHSPQQQQTPAQQQALAQAQQDAQADPNGLNVTDDQIIEFSEMFRSALAQGASPDEFTSGMVQQLGPLMAGSIVREIPLKRVSTVLQGAPGGDKDPLVRRDGQKFLAKVWELVKAKTQEAVAAQ